MPIEVPEIDNLDNGHKYLHTYLFCFSLFVIVLFVLLILAPFFPSITYGPWAFDSNQVAFENCANLFWKKLFFIDNYTGESRKVSLEYFPQYISHDAVMEPEASKSCSP